MAPFWPGASMLPSWLKTGPGSPFSPWNSAGDRHEAGSGEGGVLDPQAPECGEWGPPPPGLWGGGAPVLLATGHVSTPPGAWWGRSLAPGPLTLGPGRPCWPFEPTSPFGPAGPCGDTDRNEGHVQSLAHHGCLLVGPESGGGWPVTPCREPHPKPPLWSWGASAQDPEGSSALRAPSTTGLARGPRLVQDRERVHLRENPRTLAGPAEEGDRSAQGAECEAGQHWSGDGSARRGWGWGVRRGAGRHTDAGRSSHQDSTRTSGPGTPASTLCPHAGETRNPGRKEETCV